MFPCRLCRFRYNGHGVFESPTLAKAVATLAAARRSAYRRLSLVPPRSRTYSSPRSTINSTLVLAQRRCHFAESRGHISVHPVEPRHLGKMRPTHREAAKIEQDVPQQKQQQQQQQQQQQRQRSAASGAAFSPTRRVGARGGPQLFAQKLFTLVDEEDSEIVEWLPDGLAFRVKDIHRFSCEILEKYFNHSKFTSFQRQLNLYQFKRRKGAHAGAFHHPSFRRGQRCLLAKVRRQKVRRDLAVEARAAQRLARTQDSHPRNRSAESSGRGRTRATAQADLRPARKPDGSTGVDVVEGVHGPETCRSVLRCRIGDGPSARGVSGRSNEAGGSSKAGPWKSGSAEVEMSSSSSGSDKQSWDLKWRQQIPVSPERNPRLLHHVSTPSTAQSSDYEWSPRSSLGSSLGRASSIGSSLASSLSFSSSPAHSEVPQFSPYQFEDRSDASQYSPTSVTSPIEQAIAAVQSAQVSPCDNDLSLAAVIDASMGVWNSSQSLPNFEPFGWSPVVPEAGAPWSDPVAVAAAAAAAAPPPPADAPAGAAAALHHRFHLPHEEDFGFIDLFAANWDSSEASSGLDPDMANDAKTEASMKEAQAAGVFGAEDVLGSGGGGGGGSSEYSGDEGCS